MAQRFVCSLCTLRKFCTLKSYLLHLRIRHASNCNFRVKCGISSCKREYDKYASFYKHICRNHCDLLAPSSQDDHVACATQETMSSGDEYSEDETTGSTPVISEMQEKFLSESSDTVLKYSLKLREKFQIPASTHTSIMEDCGSLIGSVLACQMELVTCHLKNKGYNVQEDAELKSILDSSKYEHIMKDSSTTYRLIDY